MAKKKNIAPEHEACARCGYTRQAHALANYADGNMVGISVLICPFATWKSQTTSVSSPPLASRARREP